MSKKDIFNSSKKTLKEMTEKKNGRYTEKDLFSKPEIIYPKPVKTRSNPIPNTFIKKQSIR